MQPVVNIKDKRDNDAFVSDTALHTKLFNSSGDVNYDNPLPVEIPPCICDESSSSTPLLAGATWTGEATLTNGYGIIYINVYSDVASATDGLVIEQSIDGTNWDFDDTYTIPADTGKTFSIQPAGRYVRVKYINGSSDQTEFRLQTVMKNTGLDSSHRVQDTLNDDDDGRLRLSVLKLRTAANTFVSGAATNSGNFKVSLEELESRISSNSNSQLNVTPFHADGTEGSLITGVDYVSGKSGIDSSTETLQIIDYAHHEIHSGSNYRVQHNQDNIPATASSGCLTIAFFVPNQTKLPHMLWETSHEGNMTITVYEGVTVTAGNGTDVLCKNSRRDAGDTSVLQGFGTGSLVSNYVTVGENSADSIFTGGTAISVKRDYSTKNESGGQERRAEVILKANTYYAFCLENNETTTQGGQIRLEWYEHADKN